MCPCAGGCVHVRVWNWQDNFQVHRNRKHQEWPRQIWRARGKRPFSLKTCHRATAITVPTAQWIRSRWFFTTTRTVKNVSATCKCPWCCQVSSRIKPQPLSMSCEYSMWRSGSLHRALWRAELCSEWAPLSREHQSDRTECLTDPSVRLQTWILSDIFSKLNEISLSLQGKQLMLLVASHKAGAFKQKSQVWKTCVHHWGLESLSTFGHLSEYWWWQ